MAKRRRANRNQWALYEPFKTSFTLNQSPPPFPPPPPLTSYSSSTTLRITMSLLLRSGSELHLTAPPPSPIPTGKGSRCAANEILCDYLGKSLNVPELSLPDPQLPLNDEAHQIPAEIDYRSLELNDCETIDRLLRSAREFGAFMITCHEICAEELQSLANEADRVFGDLEQEDLGFRGKSFERINNKERIAWARSGKGRIKYEPEYFVPERCRDFRYTFFFASMIIPTDPIYIYFCQ